MVEWKDVAGFGVDMLVSYGAEHVFKGPSDSFIKKLVVGSGSGGLGAVAGDAVANGGFNLQDSPKAFLNGMIGGAFGAGAERLVTKGLAKGKTTADNALAEAQTAKSTADTERAALDGAEAALDSARTELRNADDALAQVNGEVSTLQAQVDDLAARSAADPTNVPLRQQWASADQQLQDAKRRAGAAEQTRAAAKRKFDEAEKEHTKLNGKRSELDKAKSDAEAAAKKAEEAAKAAGKKVDNFEKYGRGTLVGLGSATAMMLGEHGPPWEWGSDGSGGDAPGAAANRVALVWDGDAPAAAAGVMDKHPFLQGSSPQAGRGFLLRPEGLNPSIVTWFGGPTNSFAFSLVDTHQMFGDLKKKEALDVKPVPRMPASVQGVTGSAGGRAYTNAADGLNDSAKILHDTQESVVSALKTVEEISKTGKENVGKLIVGFNRYIVQHLQNDSDIHFITVAGQGFTELVQILERGAAENTAAAAGIKQPSAAQDQAAAQNLANSVGRYAGQMNNPGLNPDSSQIGVNNPWNPGNLGTSDAATPDPSALKDAGDKWRDQAENLAGAASNPSNVNPISYDPGAALNPGASQLGTPGAMGGTGGFMDMMLPLQLMAQQRAMRDAVDKDMSDQMDDLDPSRFDQAAVATMPQAQPPVGTTPWSNQAAANNAATTAAQPVAHHPAGAPNGATSTQPGTAVPKRVAGEDGLVPYAFPKETQRVPLAVAQAFDKALANKSGTDAQVAYQGTAGAWTDSKDIGEAVYPPKTGDVATFIIRQPKNEPQKAEPVPAQSGGETQIQPAAIVTVGGDTAETNEPDTGSSGDSQYRTALLVVYGDGETGTVEAVVNGEFRQFETEMSDTGGDFGEFAGFKHPKGVEAAGDTGQDSETMATSGDQTTADIPVLTMPV